MAHEPYKLELVHDILARDPDAKITLYHIGALQFTDPLALRPTVWLACSRSILAQSLLTITTASKSAHNPGPSMQLRPTWTLQYQCTFRPVTAAVVASWQAGRNTSGTGTTCVRGRTSSPPKTSTQRP